MSKRLTTEDFMEKAKLKHGDKYDYSLVDYKNRRTKVKIICLEHGVFEQLPNDHLSSKFGCKKCSIDKTKTTQKQFIQKAIKTHKNKYDYSLVDYKNTQTKVKIICHEHGVFEQTPGAHLSGQNCNFCAKNIPTSKSFVTSLEHKFGKSYIYSCVKYVNDKTPVEIICKKHGSIFITPQRAKTAKNLCSKCSYKEMSNNENVFIETSINIHGNKYNYSLVDYRNNKTPVKIICKKHGIFEQRPDSHLGGRGCKLCKESRGEKLISNYLKSNDLKFKREYRFDDCRNTLPLPFDFYLPEYNTCIEYDGAQHFEINEFFGGEKAFDMLKINDEIKNRYCQDNNLKLIRISYKDNIVNKLEEIYGI
jgi:DNA-directed RNA polymerase subunit M/transcription elongation factor TFIIS